jgi:hypothetical protein
MGREINVCCPHLDIMGCGDTKEHKHVCCSAKGGLINNSDTVFKCISDHNWMDCKLFKKVNK